MNENNDREQQIIIVNRTIKQIIVQTSRQNHSPSKNQMNHSSDKQEINLPPNWKDKISNPAQLGGIETSVLDNGLGRGTRIAWINTGTGLRYKVVIDRAMDIADAFYNQHSLAWINQLGITARNHFLIRDWNG